MSTRPPDEPAPEAPLAGLERALIDEFLRARGYDPARLSSLPAPEREALLKQASVHASAKMTEVEAKSHYLHDIHDGGRTT